MKTLVEPVYKGQVGRLNGLLRCHCGVLATHKAERFSPEGIYGTWVGEPVCEVHGSVLAASDTPPPSDRRTVGVAGVLVRSGQVATRERDGGDAGRATAVGHLT